MSKSVLLYLLFGAVPCSGQCSRRCVCRNEAQLLACSPCLLILAPLNYISNRLVLSEIRVFICPERLWSIGAGQPESEEGFYATIGRSEYFNEDAPSQPTRAETDGIPHRQFNSSYLKKKELQKKVQYSLTNHRYR